MCRAHCLQNRTEQNGTETEPGAAGRISGAGPHKILDISVSVVVIAFIYASYEMMF